MLLSLEIAPGVWYNDVNSIAAIVRFRRELQGLIGHV